MEATSIKPVDLTSARERLIVALDVDSPEKARKAVAELEGVAGAFKIGLQLFTAAGPGFVGELCAAGHRIFLDLKFHDIPNTVAKAAVECARMGVWMFNVHASGGREMMRRAVDEASEFCERSNRGRPLIIGVTVLTSSASETLRETGVTADLETHVGGLARLASEAGLDGVVASANEAALIRSIVSNEHFRIVTPGIRPENATLGDQKRVMSPGAAIKNGADYLVVGRPILGSPDPGHSAEMILNEIAEALAVR
jgi:orotidine-5'-phosphate decarboxylase